MTPHATGQRHGHHHAVLTDPCSDRAPGEVEFGFLRGLIDGMRCGILTIDVRGEILMVNEPAIRTLGLSGAPEPGTPLADALAVHPQLIEVLEACFSMSNLPNRAELELGGAGARGKTIGFTLSLIRAADGEPFGAAMFFKDLTQIEHTEEQERLKDRLAALGQMAAMLAHEIRNPLAGIDVSCTLLKRRLADDPESQKLVGKITAEVRRLSKSLDSSLEYVRPLVPDRTTQQLEPLLEDAIEVAASRCGGPDISVARRYSEAIPPFLMDQLLLRQVFVNLVLNAMEAVDGAGTVTVSTEVIDAATDASVPYRPGHLDPEESWQACDRMAIIRVSDTGQGVRKEDRDRIFHPFFTTKPQGSGVGLAMVRKIVGSHRGWVDVDSTPGQGAVFTVRLPMVQHAAEV